MGRDTPLWAWMFLLFLLVQALWAWCAAHARPPLAWEDWLDAPLRLEPARMSERELRLLPGVGPQRARAIRAELARVPDPVPRRWSDVSGIGPKVEQRIQTFFERRGRPTRWLRPPQPVGASFPASSTRATLVGVLASEPGSFLLRAGWAGWMGVLGGLTLVACSPAPSEAGTNANPPSEVGPAHGESKPVVVNERWIELDGARLHALEAGPEGAATVVLLHGARFEANTWRELGTIEQLAGRGWRVLALDLPGYGSSDALPEAGGEWLPRVWEALDVAQPIVVSPSMSGRFAIPLLCERPELFAAWVALAPVRTELLALADPPAVPTLLVWGEEDDVVPPEVGERLAGLLPRARFELLEQASHPAYLDRPEEFHRLLLGFVDEVFAAR